MRGGRGCTWGEMPGDDGRWGLWGGRRACMQPGQVRRVVLLFAGGGRVSHRYSWRVVSWTRPSEEFACCHHRSQACAGWGQLQRSQRVCWESMGRRSGGVLSRRSVVAAHLSKGRQKRTPCCGVDIPPLRGFIPASWSSAGTKTLPSSMSERSSIAASRTLIVGDSGTLGLDHDAGSS